MNSVLNALAVIHEVFLSFYLYNIWISFFIHLSLHMLFLEYCSIDISYGCMGIYLFIMSEDDTKSQENLMSVCVGYPQLRNTTAFV